MPDTNENVMDTRGGRGRLTGDPNGDSIDGAEPRYRDMEPLHHFRTVDSVTIPKEYFEKIRPEEREPRAVLRTVFGNPFPMYVCAQIRQVGRPGGLLVT